MLGGAAWQKTNYQPSIFRLGTQNLAAAPGRVRFATNASYYVKLFSNLSWNLSFYGNWDNRPPPGFSGSDYGTSSASAGHLA